MPEPRPPRAPTGRLVVALGGNALIERHHAPDAAPQQRTVRRAVEALAPLARDHALAITHGNGPQVGLLATESSQDAALAVPYPLDALVAETQGLIGYWLLQALDGVIPDREVTALLTRVLVAADDPAFDQPTKFIGPTYTEEQARTLAAAHGWSIAPDGPDWRRVVASPAPLAILEAPLIERALAAGTVVVCGGGGGVPVTRDAGGRLVGLEAVVDKDRTSALLATAIGADALLLLTDVGAVSADPTDPSAATFGQVTPAELRAHTFPAGSMGPKVDAACTFVETTGAMAAIGALADAPQILAGRTGTIVTPSGSWGGPGVR